MSEKIKPESPGFENVNKIEGVPQWEPTDPVFKAAKLRAEELAERAKLNEAIRIIEELEKEVAGMPIAKRFSREKKPTESPLFSGAPNPILVSLTEDEYKRATLLKALEGIKEQLLGTITRIHDVVMDIETTKTE